jgi:hypothetical protein
MPALLTSGTESGFWQTPDVRGFTNQGALELLAKTVEDWDEFSGIAFRAGAAKKGRIWSAPLASDGTKGGPNQRSSSGRPGLTMAAHFWPTPKANDAEKRGNFNIEDPRNGLPAAAKLWPMPDANMGARGTQPEWEPKRKSGQPAQYTINQAVRDEGAGGQLNPQFVEWLMGWPLDWTSLVPLPAPTWGAWQEAFLPEQTGSRQSETDSAQPSLSSQSASSEENHE